MVREGWKFSRADSVNGLLRFTLDTRELCHSKEEGYEGTTDLQRKSAREHQLIFALKAPTVSVPAIDAYLTLEYCPLTPKRTSIH